MIFEGLLQHKTFYSIILPCVDAAGCGVVEIHPPALSWCTWSGMCRKHHMRFLLAKPWCLLEDERGDAVCREDEGLADMEKPGHPASEEGK